MKKLILLLIVLTTHINMSYASFPVADTLKVQQDTLQTEEIKQYHSSLIKMGIDLNDCRCESCRNGIDPITNNIKSKEEEYIKIKRIWINVLIILIILSLLLGILLLRWSKKYSGGTPLG